MEEEAPRICRFKDKCWNKHCKFAHPVMKPISDKHDPVFEQKEMPMCRYGKNCTNKGCVFVHPQEREHNKKQNVNPTVKQVPEQLKENPREIEAIRLHNKQIENMRENLSNIIDSVDYNPENEKQQLHVSSIRASLLEMETQLQVYHSIKSRNLQNTFDATTKSYGREIREIYRLESRLSALSKRLDIEKHFGNSQYLIIEGETGSGKSTQIPQYLADHPHFHGKRILCTQPRKLAAISLAHRVAYEYAGGEITEPGHFIGYHIGGVKRVSPQSRIEFMTEGVMLEKIMKGGDDIFKNVGCIMIDEAHERSLLCDLLLGTFKRQDTRWKHVMIIVTSATIDLDLFSKYFYSAPTVKIKGRTFPVDIIYRQLHSSDSSDIRNSVVRCALEIHTENKKTSGDILCFLPGQEDVISAKTFFETELLKSRRGNPNNFHNCLEAKVLTLFGRQEPDEQKLVFERTGENTRKVIFATDVAETSVTIDGVVFVVDSGIKKEVVFDPKRNISSLKVTTISRSSAIQRAGRSGRTQPGTCYRLYSQDDFENMNANTAPEIFCKPLSLAVLTLQEMDINPPDFDWISAPSKDAMVAAKEELILLGAIDDSNGRATELGKLICQSQQDPKLVRMIYRGCQYSYGEAAITISSILTVSNMFFWNGNDPVSKTEAKKQRNKLSLKEGDIVTMYRLFEEWRNIINGSGETETGEGSNTKKSKNDRNKLAAIWCKKNFVNGKAMHLALTTKNDLLSIFRRTKVWENSEGQNNIPSNSEIQRLVLAGYFGHTARLIHSKNMHISRQYYALQSDVAGFLDYRAAILNYNSDSVEGKEPPKWVTYDKLFRHSSVIFPVTNVIEESWLEEENPTFYETCIEKAQTLPTELIIKYVSQECLKEILGKYFSNVDNLEKELECSIGCDIETGRLAVCCTSQRRPLIEDSIKQKLNKVLEELSKQVMEMDHVGGTRFVIGQGFEITDILFPQEFSTLYIRNIPKHFTRKYLRQLLAKNLGTLQLTEHNNSSTNTAIAKFGSKNDAKLIHRRLLDVIGGVDGGLSVSPKLESRKGANQNLSCRLKLSWPLGCSTGRAKIAFHFPEKANEFIERFILYFPQAKINMVHGERPLGRNSNLPKPKNPLPPLRAIPVPTRRQRGGRWIEKYRFDTDAINNFYSHLKGKYQYKITIDNIPGQMDEQELLGLLRPYQPKWVNIERDKGKSTISGDYDYWKEISPEEKKKKLEPLQKFIKSEDGHRRPQEFFDRNLWKAGMYIYFENNSLARTAYNEADYSSMGRSFGQPHRLEIEFTHSVSINADLYIYLEKQFLELREQARFKGINMTILPRREKSQFIIIKFQTWQHSNIRWIQENLVEITCFKKFTSSNIDLLFTRTGKLQLQPLMKKAYIYTNYNSLVLLIYGSEEIKERVSKDIEGIVEKLKLLELIDEPILLDKKKIHGHGLNGVISRICKQVGMNFWHLDKNRLYVSGKKSAIDELRNVLIAEKLARPSFGRHIIKDSCNLCFDIPDGKFITLCYCGHIFCIDCIQPMFDMMPPPFPVKCPACDKPLVLNDILKCSSQSSLLKVLEVAAKKFEEDHPEDIRKCPNQGCLQLLSYHSRTIGNKGGDFLFCDECIATYCIICSNELKKPIKSHEDDSCEDIQNGTSYEVGNHIRKIQETVLSLSCPRCKKVFYDFTGCAAVKCESPCPCAFCGLCLQDCGSDAHSHVMSCSKNPSRSYFVSLAVLNKIHNEMKSANLRAYLEKIKKQKTRKAVFSGIRKDLVDLGIKIEIFSDILEIQGDDGESEDDQDENNAVPNSNAHRRQEQLQPVRNNGGFDDDNIHRLGIDLGIDVAEQMEILREIERDRQMLRQREVMMRDAERHREILHQRKLFRQRELRNQREREHIAREQERERQRNQRRGDCNIL